MTRAIKHKQTRTTTASARGPTLAGVAARTRFTLYNLAGEAVAYYAVEHRPLELQAANGAETAEAAGTGVAHHIILIDRSGSMAEDLDALKDTLVKVLTLDEYARYEMNVTLASYAGQGDLSVHFQRVPVQEVMKRHSPHLQELRKLKPGTGTCISQALQLVRELAEPEELTAVSLHSDGYADDPSAAAEARAVDKICQELATQNVFINTVVYSDRADFRMLSRIANTVSGSCVRAGNLKALYDALYNTAKLLGGKHMLALEEPLAEEDAYQVFVSRSGRKIIGAAGPLKITGLKARADAAVYKYRLVSQEAFDHMTVAPVAQTDESVFAFARAQLAEGNLNTAKYALVSTVDATLAERHLRALTNPQLADLAHDLETAIFTPAGLKKHDLVTSVRIPERVSLLDVVRLLDEHKDGFIVNRKALQREYQLHGLKRVRGTRDEEGNLIEPWLRPESITHSDYAHVRSFDINHNAPTINMLLSERIRLVRADDGTPVTEVAGLLIDELSSFNSFTLATDGEIHVPSLKVKINSRELFGLLRQQGVLEQNGRLAPDKFDFQVDYTLRLDGGPLVPRNTGRTELNGLFEELANLRALASLLSACLEDESTIYTHAQLEELRRHYLTRNLGLSFPTTSAYPDLDEALAAGLVDTRVSYRVDIGTTRILNLGKLPSANKFLERAYEATNRDTGRKVEGKLTGDRLLEGNLDFEPKPPSPRLKITAVDEFLRPIFDDFLGIENNGKVTAILEKVGADGLQRVLEARRAGERVSREEMVPAMTGALDKVQRHSERLYRERVSPLVFYVGSTGVLPDEIQARALTARALRSQYPELQLSRDEEEGTFFVLGETVLSVYPTKEYYTRKE
jgi:Mg-chelatase subunit ChlD